MANELHSTPLSPLTAFLLCTGSTPIAAHYHERLEIYQILTRRQHLLNAVVRHTKTYESTVILSTWKDSFLKTTTLTKAFST